MVVQPWREVELELQGQRDYLNPYTDVDVWVDFVQESGAVLRRPAFWDGGSVWKVRFASPIAHEPGHVPYFLAEGAGWREAPDFEGSGYVGRVSHILDDLPVTDMEPNWQVTLGRRGLLGPGRLFIGYTEQGGPLRIYGNGVPTRYRVVDPRSGAVLGEGKRDEEGIPDAGGGPRVYICHE
jgi:hypothetical protein